MQNKDRRGQIIQRATNIGIVTNVSLGFVKIVIGVISHSIAFLSDGANNLSDSLSSLVTLVGFRASKRRPTKAHPMGYGRIEYLSALLVAFLVLMTGLSFLKNSIETVKNPSKILISMKMLIILISSIVVKILLFIFYKREGKRADSLALEASSKDSLSDSLITFFTVVSALFSLLFSFNIDGYVAIVISLFIIWNGISSILTISDTLIGKRPSKEEVEKIRSIIKNYPPLHGGYDIRIHSYGPDVSVGTIDVEVPFSSSAESISEAMEKAKKKLKDETGIIFTFGINAENQDDPRVKEMMDKTLKCLRLASPDVLAIHGFHVHFEEKKIEFDVVVSFSLKDWDKFRESITGILEMVFPDYKISFNIDPDYS